MDSTREILMDEVNSKLGWLLQFENEKLINENESALYLLDDRILKFLVDHWYTCRESEIFMNDDAIEIDEHLNVEEIKLTN